MSGLSRLLCAAVCVFAISASALALDPPVARDDDFTLVQRDQSEGDLFSDNGDGADSDPENDPFRVIYTVGYDIQGRRTASLLGDELAIIGLSPEAAGDVRALASPEMELDQDGSFTISHLATDTRLGEGQTAIGRLDYAVSPTTAVDQFTSGQGSSITIPDDPAFGNPEAEINRLGWAGDFNGDGIDDQIVSWTYETGTTHQQNLAILFGGSRPADMSVLDSQTFDEAAGILLESTARHPSTLTPIGDVTGDDRDDLILRYPLNGDLVVLSLVGSSLVQSRFIASASNSEIRSHGSGGGDVNGDGIDDLVFNLNYFGSGLSGRKTVVVYGRPGGFPDTVDLSVLADDEGFDLDIENPDAIVFLDDVNSDGRDDLGISDAGWEVAGQPNAGSAFIVFGRSSDFASDITEAFFDGTQGIRIDGHDDFIDLGVEFGPAGDIDGDGVSDLIVAYQRPVDSGGGRFQAVVYGGGDLGSTGPIRAELLPGLGFAIPPTDEGQGLYTGEHVGGVDVNGDGMDDLFIRFSSVHIGEYEDVSGYGILFGGARRSGQFVLEDLDGIQGLAIFDRRNDVLACRSNIRHLGDIDDDGFSDFGIGGGIAVSKQRFCVLFGGTSPFGGVFSRDVSTAQATFNIQGINDPPFTRDDFFDIDEAEYLYGNLISSFSITGDDDPDDGDQIFISAVDGNPSDVGRWRSRPEGGRLRVSGDGTIEFDPGTDFSSLNDGDTRILDFTYRLSSTDGLGADGTVTITINGIAELPVAAFDLFSAPPGETFTGNVFDDNGNGIDYAPDNGVLTVRGMLTSDGYAFAGQSRQTATGSTIQIDTNGTITYTPSASQSMPGAIPELIRYDINLNGNSTPARGHAALAVSGVSDAIHTVSMTVSGVDSARIHASPPELSCDNSCSFSIFNGVQISFENATPRLPDGAFADALEWGGDCAGSLTTCNLTVTTDLAVSLVADRSFPGATNVFAATLPAARSSVVGAGPVTVFATVANSNRDTARFCRIQRRIGDPFLLEYQATDAANVPIGVMNPEFELAPGGFQSFVLAFTPAIAFDGREFFPRYYCTNGEVTPVPGVNSVFLSASETPAPDILSIAVTPSGDGVIRVLAPGGRRFMSAAAVNAGAGDPPAADIAGPMANEAAITVTADTGVAVLPLTVTVCETGSDGRCLEPADDEVVTQIGTDAKTFAVFVQASPDAGIAFDPANARVYLRFRDSGGVVRSVTSAAVTAPAPASADFEGAEGRWSLGIVANRSGGTDTPFGHADLFVTQSGTAVLVRGDEAVRLSARYDAASNGRYAVTLENSDAGVRLTGQVTPGLALRLRDAASGSVIHGVHSGVPGLSMAYAPGAYQVHDSAGTGLGRITLQADGNFTADLAGCRFAGRLNAPARALNDNAGAAGCADSGAAMVGVYPRFDVARGDMMPHAIVIAGETGWAGQLIPAQPGVR